MLGEISKLNFPLRQLCDIPGVIRSIEFEYLGEETCHVPDALLETFQMIMPYKKSGRVCILLLLVLSCKGITAAEMTTGEELFRNNCMACHQQDGQGLPNVFPALAGSEVVTGSADDVVLVVLIGRGAMPSFKGSISEADLATLINYVRNSWGNSGVAITPDRVSRLAATVD